MTVQHVCPVASAGGMDSLALILAAVLMAAQHKPESVMSPRHASARHGITWSAVACSAWDRHMHPWLHSGPQISPSKLWRVACT